MKKEKLVTIDKIEFVNSTTQIGYKLYVIDEDDNSICKKMVISKSKIHDPFFYQVQMILWRYTEEELNNSLDNIYEILISSSDYDDIKNNQIIKEINKIITGIKIINFYSADESDNSDGHFEDVRSE